MNKAIVRRKFDLLQCDFEGQIHPVLQRIYAARNIQSTASLQYSLDRLIDGAQLAQITAAVDLLERALIEQASILIVGDFDADGATSTAVAIRALRMFGARNVNYLVPNRFTCGYGLTPKIVDLAKDLPVGLLITVDNGISSIEGVSAAKQKGWQVLITDHHLPGAQLPKADAIVNPNQSSDDFPSKNLAGVGVIFYVMIALRARLRERNWFTTNSKTDENLAQLLDLVALGTVADVVPLDHNNRVLVEQGLRRIRAGKGCEGIRALLDVSGRDYRRVESTDLGYVVGPRLNAAGRLDDMSLGIECLISDVAHEAFSIAEQLNRLNLERREIEAQMQEEAKQALQALDFAISGELPYGLCLYEEQWHQGVIGLLASRVKEQYHRPVIAFARAQDDELKGSARSVPGLHIRDVLDEIACSNPGMIEKFGGHAMAAGLSLSLDQFPAFQAAFDHQVRKHLDETDLQGIYLTDGELSADDLSLDFAQCLRQAGPWGQGFAEPVFDGVFELQHIRRVGECHNKLTLRVPGQGKCIDAIAFNSSTWNWPNLQQAVKLVYRLNVNEYRGVRNPQLVVEHAQILD